MRENHELERGIICEKCLNHATKEKGYTRVNFTKPIKEDSTGKTKSINRINLCDNCYNELIKLIEEFTGKPFLEKTNAIKH